MNPGSPADDEVDAQIMALRHKAATALAKAFLSEEKELLSDHAKQREQFRKLVRRYWGRPIDALTHLVVRCRDLGAEATSAASSNGFDALDHALVSLWARGCQLGFASCALLEDGFADDAHARWRTLHEVNVVALFLSRNGTAMAERYFAHLDVKNYKNALQYSRCSADLGYQPIDPAELARIKARCDAAVARFPRLDEVDWGWAAPAFPNKKRITYVDIEESVGFGKWRAHVGMAHHNVHAGPHGVAWRLGNPNGGPNVALSGPALFGLADPGHACGLSLCQLTTLLVMPRSPDDQRRLNLTYIATAEALQLLLDRVEELFFQAHQRVERLEPVRRLAPYPKSREKSSPRRRK